LQCLSFSFSAVIASLRFKKLVSIRGIRVKRFLGAPNVNVVNVVKVYVNVSEC
jgi:hypothetical protein